MAAQKKSRVRAAGTGKSSADRAAAVPKAAAGTAKVSTAVAAQERAALSVARTSEDAVEAVTIEAVIVPTTRLMAAGAEQARDAYERAKAASEQLGRALTESATVTTRGAFEVNDKVLDAWRAQSDAALQLWQQALSAGSLSDAIRLQADGARQAYESTANHWREVALVTTRWFSAAVKPISSAVSASER